MTDPVTLPSPAPRLAAALDRLERAAARVAEHQARARALEAAAAQALAELDTVLSRG